MTVGQTARMLLGSTLGFHIILAITGMGLPLFLLVAEYRGLKNHDPNYLELARRGSRALVVVFAVGAVTGTLVAAELALVWAPFMAFASQIIILPFFIEAFAFVMEGMFLGMYLYGWDRFKNPWTHWWVGVPIAIAATASGLLITVVNAWMNTPSGFRMVNGKIADVHPWKAFFNPSMIIENSHVLTMTYATVAFMLLAIAAFQLLRNPHHPYYQKAAKLSAVVGTIAMACTGFTGDLSGKFLAVSQPEKLAAAEALFHTQAFAPWALFGIANMRSHQLVGAIQIPGLLSFLSFGKFSHPVRGLLSFPPNTWPPVPLVHLFFDIMATLGGVIFLIGLLYWWSLIRRAPLARWLMWAAVLSGPAAVVAMETGWLTDEFGRQPWIIYGIMRVSQGYTPSGSVDLVGWAIMLLLVVLAASVPWILLKMFRQMPLYLSEANEVKGQ